VVYLGEGFMYGSAAETCGKRPFLKFRRDWEDNIRTDLQEIGWEGVDQIDLAQNMDRWRVLVNVLINFRGK